MAVILYSRGFTSYWHNFPYPNEFASPQYASGNYAIRVQRPCLSVRSFFARSARNDITTLFRCQKPMNLIHISWNLLGLSVPLLIALVTVPDLVNLLGDERFGLLALAWGLIGYAGALDLGIGRALTQMVARLRGEGSLAAIPHTLATAVRITSIVGLAGGATIALAALCGAGEWIRVSTTPQSQIRYTILLLAIALPAQAMSATYRGLNEAFGNFKGISLLRMGLGAVNFGAPYLVAHFTLELPWLVASLVASRLLALLIFRWLARSCLAVIGDLGAAGRYSKVIASALLRFGGWVTISSVVSPALVHSDRFLIGVVLSATAVTAYVLPYELVTQSLVLVGAISSVAFPSLTNRIHQQPKGWQPYFFCWLGIVAGTMLVVCSALALLLPIVLPMWIRGNLHPESFVVGQVLCVGVFANSIGSMFYALLHAWGRADMTALLHLIELPVFLAALYLLLNHFGIEGAAWAWTGRMVFDAIVLTLMSIKRTVR